MSHHQTKVYIQDAFMYLVAGGMCTAYYREWESTPHWAVALNGRLYLESGSDEKSFRFQCQTEHGTVQVSFKRK